MTVLLTITNLGADTDYFDLYSDLDGYTTPFETNVSKASLLAGYTSTLVPDYSNFVRVQAKNKCVNYIDITLSTTQQPPIP